MPAVQTEWTFAPHGSGYCSNYRFSPPFDFKRVRLRKTMVAVGKRTFSEALTRWPLGRRLERN